MSSVVAEIHYTSPTHILMDNNLLKVGGAHFIMQCSLACGLQLLIVLLLYY